MFKWPRVSGVPVLLYHGIHAGDLSSLRWEKKYWISVSQFRAHLAALRTMGIRTGLLHDLCGERLDSDGLPQAVLTFDDGQVSDYQFAFPLLEESSLRAEFFVNTALIDQPGYLSWQQLKEMCRAGMSFQSHGHNHVDLSRLPRPQLRAQLVLSKTNLEDRLGTAVTALAVPYGLLNSRTIDTALEVGYRTICCSRYWTTKRNATEVNRVAIYDSTGTAQFRRILAGDPLWYLRHRLRGAILFLPKRVALSYWPTGFGVETLQE